MPAGTITLTNGSVTVTGISTAFTTELKVGDFLGVVVGGVPYTLIVQTIASDTSLTITAPFTGPTTSGLAWNAVPATLQTAITQQAMNDMSKIIRGMIQEKANWQQVYSGTGTITVKLPDGSTYSGPAWNAITNALAAKADLVSGSVAVSQGGTGAKTAADALTALGALAKAGGTMTGALAFSSTAVARATAGNLGFSCPASNRIIIPFNGGAFLIQMVTAVATASSGNISFTFPQAFNSISAVLGTSGDANVSSGPVTTLNQSNTGVDFRILEKDGSLRSGTSRVNYIAMGTIN